MKVSPSTITKSADATLIANAFRDFVKVHQVLLNILIGKVGLFHIVPLIGQPVAAVLRQIEGVVDTIAFSLINSIAVAPQKAQITSDHTSLDASITLSIKTYEGISLVKAKLEFIA